MNTLCHVSQCFQQFKIELQDLSRFSSFNSIIIVNCGLNLKSIWLSIYNTITGIINTYSTRNMYNPLMTLTYIYSMIISILPVLLTSLNLKLNNHCVFANISIGTRTSYYGFSSYRSAWWHNLNSNMWYCNQFTYFQKFLIVFVVLIYHWNCIIVRWIIKNILPMNCIIVRWICNMLTDVFRLRTMCLPHDMQLELYCNQCNCNYSESNIIAII